MAIGSLEGFLSSYGTNSLSAYQREKIESEYFGKSVENAQLSGDEEKLMDACVEFESYFTKIMLGSMRNTINDDDSFIPKSNAERIFQDMLDEEYADRAARSGNGIGLAQALYKQLSVNIKKPPVAEE